MVRKTRKARRGGGEREDLSLDIGIATGNLVRVREALDSGAKLNARTGYNGATPLIAASFWGFPDIARELLSRGANINATNTYGVTALVSANVNDPTDPRAPGRLEIIRELVRRGANLPPVIPPGSPLDIVLKSRASVNQLQTMKTISNLAANPEFPLPPDVTEHIGTNYLGAPQVRLRPPPKPAGRRKTRKTGKRKSRK